MSVNEFSPTGGDSADRPITAKSGAAALHRTRYTDAPVRFAGWRKPDQTMIAQLTGRVDQLSDGACVIDVGGVGYLVQASSRTLAALPQPPGAARVLVETHVREDAIILYAFADTAERDWFRLLTTIQGVGGKVALGILSTLSPHELVRAIAVGDKAGLTRAPGVGSRLATRLLTELREKADAMHVNLGGIVQVQAPVGGVVEDAVSALINLGYRRLEIQAVVATVQKRLGDAATLDAVIRDSLKELAPKGAA